MNNEKENTPKVEIVVDHYNLRIFIDKVLHLSIKVAPLLGIQAYINQGNANYAIDFHVGKAVVTCEYANRELWEDILNKLLETKII